MQAFLLSFIMAASLAFTANGSALHQKVQQFFESARGQVALAQTSNWPQDQASCTSAGKYWCASGMASSGSSFYCMETPCTQSECTAKSYRWCADSQMNNGGWCMQSGTCPANDAASCTAQGSKWCPDSTMNHGGWCQNSGDCPIMSEAPCVAAGRSWCPPTGGAMMGWCAMSGASCPNASGGTTGGTTTTTCPSGQVQCLAAGTSPAGCYTSCPTISINTSSPSSGSNTCTSLAFALADNKTSYTIGEMVNYSYSCLPAGTSAASVAIQVVKPDGTSITYVTGNNVGAVLEQMGFSTSNLTAGAYVLRACLNNALCAAGPSVYPIPFTVVAGATTTTTTTCSSGQVQCPAVGTSLAGCYTTCPSTSTNNTTTTTNNTNTTTTTPTDTATTKASTTTTCASGQQWCPPTGGTAAGYCAMTCSSSTNNTTWTGPTAESCKKQNQYYCPSNGGAGAGWCSSLPCSETECKAASKRWCPPMPTTNTMMGGQPQGWCTETTQVCPAYTSADCTAQNGKWCKSQASMPSGMDGWCQTGGGNCPAYDDASCKAQGGSWCAPPNGSMGGWCATPPSTCPNEQKDKIDCATRGGEWCATQGGGWGWCAGNGARCPANTAEQCTARSGKWCKNIATGMTATNAATGWCAEGTNATCPAYTAEDCAAQKGLWCAPTNGGMGWCNSGSFATCPSDSKPTLPTTQPVPVTDAKQVPPKPCPAMATFACRENEEAFTVQNTDGCSVSQCRPRQVQCPVIQSAPSCTSGNEAVSYIDKDGCQKYECRAQRCPAPPADHQCATGWIPSTSAAGVCPVYECRNTEHSRTEDCVRQIVGDDFFAMMKKLGVAPSKELMEKISAQCLNNVSVPLVTRPIEHPVSVQPVQCNLTQMKRDITIGVKGELKRIDAKVNQLRRKGVSVPTTFQVLITQLNALIETTGNATSCETLFEQGQTMPGLMRDLQDQLLDIERLGQANEFVKKFNRLLADAAKEWKRVSGGLKADVKAELTATYQSAVAEFKSAIDAMGSAATSADPDSIQLASEQAYDRYGKVTEAIEHARIIRETAAILLKARSEVRSAERLASRLAKDGEDVSDLTEAIVAAKEILAETTAKKTTCAKSLTDECLGLYDRFTSTMTAFRDMYQEFAGASDFNKLFGLGDLGGKLSQLKVLDTLEQNK